MLSTVSTRSTEVFTCLNGNIDDDIGSCTSVSQETVESDGQEGYIIDVDVDARR